MTTYVLNLYVENQYQLIFNRKRIKFTQIDKFYSKCIVCYILVLIKLIFDKKLHHEQLEVTY
jgi:hypothetical protein